MFGMIYVDVWFINLHVDRVYDMWNMSVKMKYVVTASEIDSEMTVMSVVWYEWCNEIEMFPSDVHVWHDLVDIWVKYLHVDRFVKYESENEICRHCKWNWFGDECDVSDIIWIWMV